MNIFNVTNDQGLVIQTTNQRSAFRVANSAKCETTIKTIKIPNDTRRRN
jgi:hypothetical protein